ncbi:sensor histidine kinase [Flagellimonas allohymeniacidonis]|nr:sensor histidine kinase [Allomuricauda hymeniacidonis]
MRKHLVLISLGFVVGLLFYGFHSLGGSPLSVEILLNGFLGIGVSYAFHFINQFLNRYIKWRRQTGLRLLAGIVLHSVVGWSMVYMALKIYGLVNSNYNFFFDPEGSMQLKIVILLFCVVLIYNIIYFAFYSYQQYDKGQVMEVQLKWKQTELQLAALKSQLSPHFLFNCLNTLSSLFQKDIAKAEAFIRSLAKSYGYTLRSYEDKLVSVEEEMNFVQSYCFLMQTRFQEQIFLSNQLPNKLMTSKVPPLTLQMLVENAIKHNVTSENTPLNIQIKHQEGAIWVVNNKTKARPNTKSLNIGLGNITSRYKLLANETVQIADESNFIVKLPVLL